ncbi:uncharacterized protein LOC143587076 isoform X2 [Bidens hawaiensis]|uniref:uncharacterized protein LOC143587076 isoform X2 n=1 Tax=Bidens hawaiensis TaxID=980011 RepID=UPI00404AD002
MCNNKLEIERGKSTYYVCKDHEDTKPRFMYCLNASLIDSTATTDVVFFNDAMTDMMGTSCKDMVTLRGNTDKKILPPEMLSKIGVPMIFNLTIKPNGSIVVTKATNINQDIPKSATKNTPSVAPQINDIIDAISSGETMVASTITPVTPNPKSLATKRPIEASTDYSIKKVKK